MTTSAVTSLRKKGVKEELLEEFWGAYIRTTGRGSPGNCGGTWGIDFTSYPSFSHLLRFFHMAAGSSGLHLHTLKPKQKEGFLPSCSRRRILKEALISWCGPVTGDGGGILSLAQPLPPALSGDPQVWTMCEQTKGSHTIRTLHLLLFGITLTRWLTFRLLRILMSSVYYSGSRLILGLVSCLFLWGVKK